VNPKKYRGKKKRINILLSLQTESSNARPKKYRGQKIRLKYSFLSRRRRPTTPGQAALKV
jgi:hypothetical protein